MSIQDHLHDLRKACLAVASAETSCGPDEYDREKSPLHGHCGAVSSMVRGMFGGDIVTGRVNGVQHYWNRLDDGTEVDLTSCQFGGDGYTPFKKGKKVKRKEELTHLGFIAFAVLVKDKLKSGV